MEAILVDGKVLLYKDVMGVYFLHKNDVCVKCGRLKRFELLRPDSKVSDKKAACVPVADAQCFLDINCGWVQQPAKPPKAR